MYVCDLSEDKLAFRAELCCGSGRHRGTGMRGFEKIQLPHPSSTDSVIKEPSTEAQQNSEDIWGEQHRKADEPRNVQCAVWGTVVRPSGSR